MYDDTQQVAFENFPILKKNDFFLLMRVTNTTEEEKEKLQAFVSYRLKSSKMSFVVAENFQLSFRNVANVAIWCS